MKLDLGAGYKEHDGYLRADIAGTPDVRCDARALPFQDGAFEEVRMEHLLEHIDAGDSRINTMNEAHRVLEDGGRAKIEVPVFPFWPSIADPTHKSYFVSQSFDYFTSDFDETRGNYKDLYGIKPWKIIDRKRLANGEILGVEMEKCAS